MLKQSISSPLFTLRSAYYLSHLVVKAKEYICCHRFLCSFCSLKFLDNANDSACTTVTLMYLLVGQIHEIFHTANGLSNKVLNLWPLGESNAHSYYHFSFPEENCWIILKLPQIQASKLDFPFMRNLEICIKI